MCHTVPAWQVICRRNFSSSTVWVSGLGEWGAWVSDGVDVSGVGRWTSLWSLGGGGLPGVPFKNLTYQYGLCAIMYYYSEMATPLTCTHGR